MKQNKLLDSAVGELGEEVHVQMEALLMIHDMMKLKVDVPSLSASVAAAITDVFRKKWN